MNKLKRWFIEMGSPPLFYNWSSKIIPWLGLLTLLVLLIGLYWGLFVAPMDYKQGDVYRIIYIHVPSAILGESIFIFMAICGFINVIWRAKISGMMLKAAAPIGMSFTLLVLVTGSVGKTYLGHLVGLGCTPHFNAYLIFYLCSTHWFAFHYRR